MESVYRRSMLIALRQAGITAEEEVPTPVYFRGLLVGTFYADLIVEDLVILELKTAELITKTHEAQLLHYLRSSTKEIGFVLCFGPTHVQARRHVQQSQKAERGSDGQKRIREDDSEISAVPCPLRL